MSLYFVSVLLFLFAAAIDNVLLEDHDMIVSSGSEDETDPKDRALGIVARRAARMHAK